MESKKLQTKLFLRKDITDLENISKYSSTSILTYYDDKNDVFDINSYYDLNVTTIETAVEHLDKYRQLHNYYSLAYNELVPNICKYLVKVTIRKNEFDAIYKKLLSVDSPLNGSMQNQFMFDLKCAMKFISENPFEFNNVAIAVYPKTITGSTGFIQPLKIEEDSQLLIPTYMVNEHTEIKELDLGGFDNIVSGINSAKFEFYPFLMDNNIYIQIANTGVLTNNGLTVSYASYDSTTIEPVGLLEISFVPLNEKFAKDSKTFNVFESRIRDFIDPSKSYPLEESEKLQFKIKDIKYTDHKTNKSGSPLSFESYFDRNKIYTIDLLHRPQD